MQYKTIIRHPYNGMLYASEYKYKSPKDALMGINKWDFTMLSSGKVNALCIILKDMIPQSPGEYIEL